MTESARALHGAAPPRSRSETEPEPPRGEPLPVRIRRARHDDRAAVMAFAATTWDGWDYIPHAWPEWIDAPDGVLLVALPARPVAGEDPHRDADGHALDPDVPIAMSRVALLSATEGWVEGIRVDPRVRGRSVATQLQIAELTWAAAHGISLIRYITGADNEGSHRLGARHGFRLIGKLRGYGSDHDVQDDELPFLGDDEDRRLREAGQHARARTLDALAAAGWVVDPSSEEATIDQLWALVEADATFRAGHRLYESRPWTAQALTRTRFAAHMRRGEVLADRSRHVGSGTAGAVAIFERIQVTADDPTQHLSVLAGEPAAALRLARTVRDHAGQPVRVRLPDPDPPLMAGMHEAWGLAGFAPRSHTNHLLERRATPGEPPPLPDRPELLVFEDEPRPVATAPVP